jgi:hypothetical protein
MPDEVIDPGRKPDAILYPTGWPLPGRRSRDEGSRTHELCRHFEGLLGATPGQTAHLRDVGPHTWMATLSPHDTLLHPEGHPRAKFPRYDWRPGADGLQLGFLKTDDEAR